MNQIRGLFSINRIMNNFPQPPAGYQAHQEASTQILIKITEESAAQPSEAFINPVQEYNRDLSISAIKAWSSMRNQELESKWIKSKNSKNKKRGPSDSNHELINSKKIKQAESDQPTTQDTPVDITDQSTQQPTPLPAASEDPPNNTKNTYKFQPQKFSALEALSATGLRAIRYAKEIPSLKSILANDLSPSAVKLIKANITHNGLDPEEPASQEGRVKVNQGDACDLMYSHRQPSHQFDVVDLDPYGTAAPFIDAAVQCVRDGGLLCVTCTDLAVLAGSAYPEKCFSNYGGTSMRAEYSHEYALRQVIHSLASSASRYGKQIEPLLSLSIDFYVRIFVRVSHSPAEVKKCITNTAIVYVCSGCSAFHFQSMGRANTKPTKAGRGTNVSYQNALGPPMSSGSDCEECGGKFHVAGPLWSGPLHDPDFCDKILEEVQADDVPLKTVERIRGMVGLAKTELPESPFFFTPAKLSGIFKCSSPSLSTVGSAILNGGFSISRSHCQPGSIKTDAPRAFIHDLMKAWIDSQKTPTTTTTTPLKKKDSVIADTKADEVSATETSPQVNGHGQDNLGDGAKDEHVGEADEKVVKEVEVNQDDQVMEVDNKPEKVEEATTNNNHDPNIISPERASEILEACQIHGAKHSGNPRLMSLLSRPPRYQIDLKYNKLVEKSLLTSLKIVRYQSNPTPNWGPKARAIKK
ncbi:hypothetical protein MJO28_013122 [Puccinia striiformis f. sp. tritici]|uniref:Uncharacterized protein n=1 Tax=Puccinia striiformis f. sp. tritici TaxID=168172 RepID=A0ACC0DZ96_9BASI|nr:hypothetical protein MJO28_013122 [Puccinia striiformis f. sp. tritici]